MIVVIIEMIDSEKMISSGVIDPKEGNDSPSSRAETNI